MMMFLRSTVAMLRIMFYQKFLEGMLVFRSDVLKVMANEKGQLQKLMHFCLRRKQTKNNAINDGLFHVDNISSNSSKVAERV